MIDERRQIGLLSRTFFGRLFESDLMPPGLPQIQLVVWVIAFLGAPSALAPILLSKKYVWLRDAAQLQRAMETDRTMALLLSMIATGLITLVLWENVFPDRRDGRILGVLPVRPRTFVVARMIALMAVFVLLVAAMTVLSSLSFGMVSAVFGGGFVRRTVEHFLAAAGLEATVFFGIVALQCALLNTLGPATAQRLALLLQIVLVVGLLQLPLLLPLVRLPQVPALAPVIGLSTCLAALLLYGLSYRRLTRLALEGIPAARPRRVRVRDLSSFAARLTALSPGARAVCAFTLRTVARSRQHRILLAGWMGLACAIVLGGILPLALRGGWASFQRPSTVVLAAPLVFASLTLVALRMLFALPAEIRANWMLRFGQPIPLRQALDGAAAALVAALLPSLLLAWGSATFLWGARVGMIHLAYCTALGVGLAQLLAMGLDKVPFTCTYVPGKARFVKLWALYLTAFSTYTFTMAGLEAELLARGGIFTALAILSALALVATIVRSRRAADVAVLRFEEEPEGTLTVLSVQS